MMPPHRSAGAARRLIRALRRALPTAAALLLVFPLHAAPPSRLRLTVPAAPVGAPPPEATTRSDRLSYRIEGRRPAAETFRIPAPSAGAARGRAAEVVAPAPGSPAPPPAPAPEPPPPAPAPPPPAPAP